MWLCRVQGKFSRSVNLEVLDMGVNRARKFSALLNLDVLDLRFLRVKKDFMLSEVKSDAD